MPLSDPVAAAGSDSFGNFPITMAKIALPNKGSDSSVVFSDVLYHPIAKIFCVGGNTDYYGTMKNNNSNLIQADNLPVFAVSTFESLNVNYVDNGVLAIFGNVVGRCANADGSTPWFDITPITATSRNAVWSMNDGSGIIYTGTNDLTGPSRVIELSDDNGVIWDSNPGLNIPNWSGRDLDGAYLNRGGTLVACTGSNSTFVINDDPRNENAWELIEGSNGIMNMVAFNDAGTVAIGVTSLGDILVAPGLTAAGSFLMDFEKNYFKKTLTTGNPITAIVYSAALSGFVLIQQSFIGFISDSDLTTCVPGALIFDIGGIISKDAAASDDAGNVLAVVQSNFRYISTF